MNARVHLRIIFISRNVPKPYGVIKTACADNVATLDTGNNLATDHNIIVGRETSNLRHFAIPTRQVGKRAVRRLRALPSILVAMCRARTTREGDLDRRPVGKGTVVINGGFTSFPIIIKKKINIAMALQKMI